MTKKETANSHQILPNVYIYKRDRSPYWWGYLKLNKKKFRKSLKTESFDEAQRLVVQFKQEILEDPKQAPALEPWSFVGCAEEYLKQVSIRSKPVRSGSTLLQKTEGLIYSPSSDYGLHHEFGNVDIRSITSENIRRYIARLVKAGLSNNRIGDYVDLLKSIISNKDLPTNFNIKVTGGKKTGQRGFFTLGNYRKLKNGCKKLIGQRFPVGKTKFTTIDADLYPLVVFLMGTMLRPTVKELYDLRAGDISIKKNEEGLEYLSFVVERKRGETQNIISLSSAVGAYKEITKRGKHKPKDFLFMPDIDNRDRVKRKYAEQFKCVLESIGLTEDHHGDKLSLYSLRHTAIVMNIRAGRVPTLQLARLAGTSLQMIDNFYYPKVDEIDSKLINEFVR